MLHLSVVGFSGPIRLTVTHQEDFISCHFVSRWLTKLLTEMDGVWCITPLFQLSGSSDTKNLGQSARRVEIETVFVE